MVEFVRSMSQHSTLKTLHVVRNGITDRGAKALAENTTLTKLDCSRNKIGDEGIKALARNKTLRELRVKGNNFGKDGLAALIENRSLTSLSIEKVKMDNGLLESLVSNSILTSLEINRSGVNDEGAKILALSALRRLIVSDNQICDSGAIALAGSKTLTYLGMDRNKVGQKGIEALTENLNLVHLDISYNEGEDGTRHALEKMWKRRIEWVEWHDRLRNLLFLLFSREGLAGYCPPKLPLEMEKLVLDYCEPPQFTFRNVCCLIQRNRSIDMEKEELVRL
jgi:uncharacterized protein (UPF0262 family)